MWADRRRLLPFALSAPLFFFLAMDIGVYAESSKTFAPVGSFSGWVILSLGGSSALFGELVVGVFGLSCLAVWKAFGFRRMFALYAVPVVFFDRLLLMGVVSAIGRFKVMSLHAMNGLTFQFPNYPLNILNDGIVPASQYCPQGEVCSWVGNNFAVLGFSALLVGVFTVRRLPRGWGTLLSALAFSVAVFSLLNWPTALYTSDFDAHLLTIPALVRHPLGLGIFLPSLVAGLLALIPKRLHR